MSIGHSERFCSVVVVAGVGVVVEEQAERTSDTIISRIVRMRVIFISHLLLAGL